MNIACIGYGQMGHMIEQIAKQRKHNVIARIDPVNPEADYADITPEALDKADVCIEFSHPESVVKNIQSISKLKKNLVVGTTGWTDKIDIVKNIISDSNTGLIYASNFSLGMNIYLKIIEFAARVFNKFDNYDVAGLEMHHNKKADSPSGTAKSIANLLINNIKRKDKPVYEIVDRKIQPEELHFASIRMGSIPGTHKVIFDSAQDDIELIHTVRNREGFAVGAVIAAEWIYGKKGIYTIDDLMKNIIK